MNNKTLGNSFESDFAALLAENRFWAHVMAPKAGGQPSDIIAARDGRGYLIDAKVCSGGSFPLRRVEPNQYTAMNLWEDCGNGSAWFAIRLSDDSIYMLTFFIAQTFAVVRGRVSLSEEDIRREGLTFEKWLEVMP